MRNRIVVLTVACASVFAACSSGSESSTTTAAVPTTAVATTIQPTTSVVSPTTGATTTVDSIVSTTMIAGPHLTYLALGDSHVYGLAADCGSCTPYPHLLAERLPSLLGQPVELIDAAQHNKLTAARLLDELQSDSWAPSNDAIRTDIAPHAAIASADIITLTLAANSLPWYNDPDFCDETYDQACIDKLVPAYLADLNAVLAQIETLRAGKPTAIRVTTMWNDTIVGADYKAWFYSSIISHQALEGIKSFLDAMDTGICTAANAHGAVCVDVYHLFNGADGTTAMDGGYFKPQYGDLNQHGQDQIADAIVSAGFAEIGV